MSILAFNPELDLKLEKVVDLPVEKIWLAWTTPEYLKQWFCPLPWRTTECEIDLRPGGRFFTVMESPEGEKHSANGCYLEIINNRSLIWTDALGPEFRPSNKPNQCLNDFFTGGIVLEPLDGMTKYTAFGLHASKEVKAKHEEIGFKEGWGAALDQLIQLMKSK